MKNILFVLFFLNTTVILAQDPASIKWNQITTDEFCLIYPNNYDSVAKRIGTMLLIENKFETHSMQCKPRRISIVLHNQSSISNAFVALAPRRAEFFHTPTQTSLSPMDWNASLALHEYRHVVQYEMLRHGFAGKFMHFMYGDIGLGTKSLTTPDWFYEGDAVATETALSNSGRGRSPDFSKDLRAQLLDKKKYSYAKAVCGSYKNYVPNHYILGYHLIAYGRNVWNADLWRIAHQNSASVIGLTPFSKGIKLVTGMNKYKFYDQALTDLKTYWENQLKNQKLTFYETIKTDKKTSYTDYSYPFKLSDNSIIALKSGMGDIPTIVKIDPNGFESSLVEVSFITNDNPINTNGKQIVWVEEIPDLRWDMRSYSDIMLCNISDPNVKRITQKQHFYAPSISPDGSKIIAVEVTGKAIYNIVILDVETGTVLKRINTPQNDFIFTPHWSKDGKTVTCILLGKTGKILAQLDTETDTFTSYNTPSFTDVSEAFSSKNYIIYTSEHNGINNEIYAFDTITKHCFQITNTRFGCRYASMTKDNNLLFSTYTSNGYVIGSIPFDNRQWNPSDFATPTNDTLAQGLLKDEIGVPNLFDSTQTFVFKEQPYRKVLHLINPHSWGFGINTNSTDASRHENDISIKSNNLLGTTSIIAGYRYDALGSSKKYFTIQYLGLYPIFQIDYETGLHGFVPEWRTSKQQEESNVDTLFCYNRTLFSQDITIPFNLSSDNYYRYIDLIFSNSFEKVGDYYHKIFNDKEASYKKEPWETFNGYLDYLKYRIYVYNVKSYAQKDIQPHFGQIMDIGIVTSTPINSSSSSEYFAVSNRFYVKGDIYFPGILKHHGIHFYGGYTTNLTHGYFVTSHPVPFARGYLNEESSNADKFHTLSVNYALPLLNPDLSIQSLIYIKRINANLFADYSKKDTETFSSYGIELNAVIHLLNITTPVNWGIRISKITNKTILETIYSVNF